MNHVDRFPDTPACSMYIIVRERVIVFGIDSEAHRITYT